MNLMDVYKVPDECFDPHSTANDRVSSYFEHLTGKPMTRDEKVPLGAVIHGEYNPIDQEEK